MRKPAENLRAIKTEQLQPIQPSNCGRLPHRKVRQSILPASGLWGYGRQSEREVVYPLVMLLDVKADQVIHKFIDLFSEFP